MGELLVLTHDGTQNLTWDPNNPAEAASVEQQFHLLIENGYSAFLLNDHGGEGQKMFSFDAEAKKIIMVPKLGGG